MAFWNRNKKTSETDGKKKKKKPVWREWLDAGVFAIVAATLIRTFLFEAYTIPTGSMENSLLVNDFLFVSKLAYGPRLPMTPIAIPLVHNTIPLIGGKSYIDGVQWKYKRLPGFGHIKRYDVVVFNFPEGDTIALETDADYYGMVRSSSRDDVNKTYTIISRPVDKEENYIKRCVALPGDTLEVRDALLYINGRQAPIFPHSKLIYDVTTNGTPFDDAFLYENNIELAGSAIQEIPDGRHYRFEIENERLDALKKLPFVVSANVEMYPKEDVRDGAFPQDPEHFKWNRDNFGPLVIPKAGATVTLTPENIALYRRVIINYEGNTLVEQNGKFIINGKEANTYTFKMDYYWMMGDNRDNSLDSRYWGYVPIDHVVGKAWFVWLSFSKQGLFHGIRWGRLFHGVHSLEK
jgi:signal peptidase I